MCIKIPWWVCQNAYSESIGLGQSLKFCISLKLPGDANVVNLWATLWVLREWCTSTHQVSWLERAQILGLPFRYHVTSGKSLPQAETQGGPFPHLPPFQTSATKICHGGHWDLPLTRCWLTKVLTVSGLCNNLRWPCTKSTIHGCRVSAEIKLGSTHHTAPPAPGYIYLEGGASYLSFTQGLLIDQQKLYLFIISFYLSQTLGMHMVSSHHHWWSRWWHCSWSNWSATTGFDRIAKLFLYSLPPPHSDNDLFESFF